jgi:EmrB/QacA subfamily drug resistance transporter
MNKLLKWVPLLVMSLALCIIILDTTILNVTLRTIIQDLHTDIQKLQWVITAYSLMLAAFTITGGRLGDLFGRKKMFVLGAIIFAVGSFITSIAHSVGVMILGEALIEGIGAALMMPATASLLRSTYKGRDLAVAFGIWGGVIAASAALGPVIGGWFTTHYTWRWAFRINVVVAAILVLASALIKEYKDTEEKPSIDFMGVVLSALGMLSLVFGFIQSSTYGWWHEKAKLVLFGHAVNLGGISATPYFILLAIIILAVFYWWEGVRERAGKTPLVSQSLFKNSTFMSGSTLSGLLAVAQAGLSFSAPVYFQSVLNLSPIQTGIAMIPMTAVIFIAAPLSSFMAKTVSPKRIIQLGVFITLLGFVLMHESIYMGASQWMLAPGFAYFGFGFGLIFGQASNLTLSAVSVQQSGEASGVNNTLRSLGQTLGSAILGAVLITSLATQMTAGINKSKVIPDSAKPGIIQAVSSQTSNIEFGSGADLGSAQVPEAITKEITRIGHEATVEASKTSLIYGIVFIVLTMLVSFNLPNDLEIKEQSPATRQASH